MDGWSFHDLKSNDKKKSISSLFTSDPSSSCSKTCNVEKIANPDELERLGFRAELDEESGNVLFRSTRKRDDNTTNESSSSTLAACPTDGC